MSWPLKPIQKRYMGGMLVPVSQHYRSEERNDAAVEQQVSNSLYCADGVGVLVFYPPLCGGSRRPKGRVDPAPWTVYRYRTDRQKDQNPCLLSRHHRENPFVLHCFRMVIDKTVKNVGLIL